MPAQGGEANVGLAIERRLSPGLRSFPWARYPANPDVPSRTWVKGPKTVNHLHQVGLGELLSMASTRLRGEVGGPIGLTRPTNKKLLVALLLRPAIML
jgi:hypothetical protein